MDQAQSEKLDRMHSTLYGPPGKPEESLMVQIINSVKEVKSIRIAHDELQDQRTKDRAEITSNSRTNRNLVKLMWLVISLIIATIGGILTNG